MGLPFNITNPGIYIPGLLTSQEANFVTDLVTAGGSASENDVLTWKSGAPSWEAPTGGSGVSDGDKGDITVASSGTVWTIDNNVVTVAKMSATGTPSATTFLRGDGSWSTPSGSGDVVKVGTPVNNQLGVWTGDGTIEGDSSLTFDTTDDTLSVAGKIIVPFVRASSSAGVTIENSSGTDVVTFGSGPSTLSEFAGDVGINGDLYVGVHASPDGNSYISLVDGVNADVTIAPAGTGKVMLPGLKATSSSGILFEANGGSDVALFGAGGGQGATFYGGVNIDGATRLATTLTGILSASSGSVSAVATTGSGSVVLATSPTLVTPILGTPTSVTLTNATGLPLSTGVIGQLPLANGGTGANLTDPGADRILFWDDSAGVVTWLTIGSGLSITDTTITATAGSGDVVGPASSTDNALALFDSTTGKLIKNSTVSLASGVLAPITTNTASLGSTTLMWSDLFLASGGVINWNNGELTLTQSGNELTVAGTGATFVAPTIVATLAFTPDMNDGASLGTAGGAFSDLFLAEGGVINWDNGDATLTQSGNDLTLAGASLTARIKPRVLDITANSATPTINTDNCDFVDLTGQTNNITSMSTNLSGTPTEGQKLWIAMTAASGTPSVTWGASFEDSTVTAPTALSTTRVDAGFVWNATTSKWRCVAKA